MYSSISGHSVENWSSEKPGSPKFVNSELLGEQASETTGFRQYVQKWNNTYLQNYQMVGLHSKVGFSIIL